MPDGLPNIVFILTDDLGYADLRCQNPDSKIPTPNLDRLASQGVRFLDAHSPSAVCTPTRYGVLTGRYCWRSSLKRRVLGSNAPPLIDPDRVTVGKMLQEKGYQTACVGKWHLGNSFHLLEHGDVTAKNIDWKKPLVNGPLQQGFDYYFGRGEPAWTFIEYDRVLVEPTEKMDLTHLGAYLMGPNNLKGVMAPGYEHKQMLPNFTERAVGFIDRAAQDENPFFLYFTPMTPHKPIVPNETFLGKSEAGVYGDFVCELDWAVGEILEALDRNGVADNSLIIFTSDNGPENIAYDRIQEFAHYSMGDWRGVKRDNWEGGHRVAFFARWPGKIKPGTTCDEVICLTDFMATVAEIVDYALPDDAGEDSYNVLSALLGEDLNSPIREATVHHSADGWFAIRQGDWVLIDAESGDDNEEPDWFKEERSIQPHSEPGELFNISDDPAERRNRYAEFPERVAELKSLLGKYKADGRSVHR